MRAPEDAIHSQHASIEIDATPAAVYALVSDITRMGEWSPEATGGRWVDGGTGQVGDWFVGENELPERSWERDCQIAAADPGRDFTFVVGGIEANCTTWSYELEPTADGGTLVTERWWMVNRTPAMAAAFTDAPAIYEERTGPYTAQMLQTTLANLKAAAES
jgi:hypothetical protein